MKKREAARLPFFVICQYKIIFFKILVSTFFKYKVIIHICVKFSNTVFNQPTVSILCKHITMLFRGCKSYYS